MSTATVRCETCGDSHQMWHSGLDRYVPCTRCPVPCRECAGDDGRGAYCAVVDCSCACHHWLGANEKSVPPPDPPTREALVSLLRRWRVANAEGDDENEVLADETDRAIAAEARRPTACYGYADLTPDDVAQMTPHVRRQLHELFIGGETRHATRAKQLASGDVGCQFLRGTSGRRCSCSIYESRPEVCRKFRVGGAMCRSARTVLEARRQEEST